MWQWLASVGAGKVGHSVKNAGLCRQHLADAAHFATDVRLGNLRIAPCHVRIRMAQNLGDDVNRHPVFNRQGGERMARQV